MFKRKNKEEIPLPEGSYLLIEGKNNKKTKIFKCSGEGKGDFYKDYELVYKGEYKECKYNGEGELFKDNKLIYKGTFKDDKYDGEGKLFKDSELIYEGTFKDDKYYTGTGKLFNNYYSLYEGDFKDGKYNGNGKLYRDGMAIYTGTFEDGKYYYTCCGKLLGVSDHKRKHQYILGDFSVRGFDELKTCPKFETKKQRRENKLNKIGIN